MILNFQKQTGSAHIIIVIILVVALFGALGFVLYQNFINEDLANKDSKETIQSTKGSPDSAIETPTYTFDDALAGINRTLLEKGCGGSGVSEAIVKDTIKEVDDFASYTYQGGLSKINTGLSYAFVQYGCGSQGSVALLKKTNNEWTLVSEEAREHPMCDNVRGQEFPASIIDKCYTDNRATEPVAI
jgi:hypothetical protein